MMLGGMLAGHSESGGEIIEKSGKKYKLFYGMSSDTAMKKHAGGVAEYRSASATPVCGWVWGFPVHSGLNLLMLFSRASEGKTVEVPYKGPVEGTIRDVLGGVRSTCTYVGAGKLKELSRRTTFIRVTQQLNTVYGNDG